MTIEDEIFTDALKAKKLRRTKSMYERDCRYPHKCTMCFEQVDEPKDIYKLKPEFDIDNNTPYLFICSDCYESLLDDTKKSN